jgi:sterol desaturase/sphingolipid hydroxylase (fatty acid hydroxylase superfamily)
MSDASMPGAADLAAVRATLAGATLVALLAWETAQPFIAHFGRTRAGWRERGRHAGWNLGLGLFNAIVVALLFAGAWTATMAWTARHGWGLLPVVAAPPWLRWPLAILLLDAWTYTWHRLNHVVPWLWRFHRLHHSDTQVDVTTANRFHLVEIALSGGLRLPVLAVIGCHLEELALYEILFFACVQFHHANIALPPALDRALSWFVVTPFTHKVHHSIAAADANTNFSSLLTIWDRLGRTWRRVPEPRSLRFGADEHTGYRRTRK